MLKFRPNLRLLFGKTGKRRWHRIWSIGQTATGKHIPDVGSYGKLSDEFFDHWTEGDHRDAALVHEYAALKRRRYGGQRYDTKLHSKIAAAHRRAAKKKPSEARRILLEAHRSYDPRRSK